MKINGIFNDNLFFCFGFLFVMAPNTNDELDTSLIGEFQADKIDNVDTTKVKKMIPCVGLYSKGYALPEQGMFRVFYYFFFIFFILSFLTFFFSFKKVLGI